MAKLLILEDDYQLARTWKTHLASVGHEVCLAFTSSEAKSHAEHEDFDFFVVDLMIDLDEIEKKDSGQEFLKFLARRSGMEFVGERVIGVSGFLPEDNTSFINTIFRSHAVEQIMAKPVTGKDLENRMDQMAAIGAQLAGRASRGAGQSG